MSPQSNLAVAAQNDRSLKAQLLALYPELAEDERTLIDSLDGLSDLNEQIVAAMRVALEREAYAAGLADFITRMGERKARLSQGANNIRSAVLSTMIEAGRTKITAPDFTISTNPGRPGVTVTDEALLPPLYVVTTRRPDMKAINEAVKAGQEVPGTSPRNPQPFLTCRTG